MSTRVPHNDDAAAAVGLSQAAGSADHAGPPETVRRRVAGWRARSQIDAAEVQGYSRFVGLMKMILPAAGLILVALVVLYSVVGRDGETMQLTYERMQGQVSDDMTLVKPKLTGADGRNQAFTVTARAAKQEIGKVQRLSFFDVVGDIVLADKSWVAIEARRGSLDADAKRLDLTGALNIYSDRGYECHTDAATYDIARGELTGNRPISCHGPLGVIHANAFDGVKAAGRMTFSGGVKTTFIPPPRKSASRTDATPASPPALTVEPVTSTDGGTLAPVPPNAVTPLPGTTP